MHATFTHLIGSRKGAREKFDADTITVGRAPDNALHFGDSERRVSSHHAEIRRKDGHYLLRDLGSTNGTMINGRRVIASEIHPDDLLEFGAGGPLLRFEIEPAPEPAILEKPADEEIDRTPRPEHSVSQSSIEKLVSRAFHNRISNVWLITALVAAMAVGAFAGILLSSPRRGEMSFAAVAARNNSAVVFIRVEFELVDNTGRAVINYARTGSGFVATRSGLIVTNRHLIRDWEYNQPAPGLAGRTAKIEIIFPGNKREDAVPAEEYRLANTKETDVAILKIAEPSDLPVVYGMETNMTEINQGDEIAVIGYPLGLDLLQLTRDERIETSLSTGVVSRVSQDFIQLYLRAYQGNSGGPVLNRRGRVIGILTANVGSAQDIALCTPVRVALNMISEESRNN